MRLIPLGDSALTIELETPDRAVAVARALSCQKIAGVLDVMAAFSGVTVFYELHGSYSQFCDELRRRARDIPALAHDTSVRLIEIPVRYAGAAGSDLEEISQTTGLPKDEIISRHSDTEYTVLAIGFMPGFAYLGRLPEILHTPRRATPRTKVPAGAVGIGGPYTGVYPFASPGGWNIIGQTSLRLFDASRDQPSLLQVGDRVRFISEE